MTRAVVTSDVHFSSGTVELAANGLRQAGAKAMELRVPFVIAGDLHDTKDLLKGKVINRLMQVLLEIDVPIYVLIGNHDLVNEKSTEHALEFLKFIPNVIVIDSVQFIEEINAWLIPYQADVENLIAILAEIPHGSDLIIHQGIKGAFMGEYVVDKSSIDPSYLAPFRVVSGHYHRKQVIITDTRKHATAFEVGTFHYIGTLYTITHSEANDGDKGYRILTEDTLDFIPTYLRKHRKIECNYKQIMGDFDAIGKDDVLWVQVSGPASELDKLSKKEIGMHLIGHQNFKLDKVYDEVELMAAEQAKTFTDAELLDKMIEDSEETKAGKLYLKQLWREIL